MRRLQVTGLCLAFAALAQGQQVPDRNYRPEIGKPRYAANQGPVVCVDEAHHNFHTLDGRFFAFGELLRRDGYQMRASKEIFTAEALAKCRVLVISNAQPSDDEWNVYPYPTPSAFTDVEVGAVHRWVSAGGSLLLIADHMPLAGAAKKLASVFEVEFVDGFAQRETMSASGEPFDLFTTADGSLREHAIVQGRAGESVTALRTFTGQAFRAPKAEPLLVFPKGYVQLMPLKAWEFTPQTRRAPVTGWLQGAVQKVGRGRAAFFGEAAMFSAQLAGGEGRPMGMNAPGAEQNFRFTLNLLGWLTASL